MKWRKALATLLALVMTLQSVPALAAETGEFDQTQEIAEEQLSAEVQPETVQVPASGDFAAAGEHTAEAPETAPGEPSSDPGTALQSPETPEGVLASADPTQPAPPAEAEWRDEAQLQAAETQVTTVGTEQVYQPVETTAYSLKYFELSDGTIRITGYTGTPDSQLELPAQINGKTVTQIGKESFSSCPALISVKLPDSITSMGYRCFYNCTGLSSINIPKSWAACPSYDSSKSDAGSCSHIFEGCSSLKSVTIPEGVTKLATYAFSYCDYLEEVNLPSTLTDIGQLSFYHCSRLKRAELPVGVTSVTKSAFRYCKNLSEVIIPDTVTSLSLYAFEGCTSLTSVRIPDGITSIGYQCFYNCSSLNSVNIPKSWKECPSHDSANSNADTCSHIFEGCSSLKSVTVPEGVTKLPTYAFSHCDYLEEVNLPSTLTDMGQLSFYQCSRLKRMELPVGVTSITKSAFRYCKNLSEVIIPDTVTSLSLYAFEGCTSLTSVRIPDGVTSIGYQCFYNCSSLSSINIPKSWAVCPSYSSTEADADTCGHIFENCTSLKSVTVPEGVTKIPIYAFAHCNKLEEIKLPASLREIGRQGFYSCKNLKKMVIPSGVTAINKSTFCYCSSLAEVVLPETVTEIQLFAFNECTSLTSVRLPDAVTSLGYQCFYGCTRLTSINIPKSWAECPSNSSTQADADTCGHVFENCTSLKSVTVPEGVTKLPIYAFAHCNKLEEIKLPSSLREIGRQGFYSCKNLKKMVIPSGVTSINKSTFCYCSGLAEVVIPETVTEIQLFAFDGCTSLTSVRLPDAVTSLGYQCFYGCTNLSTINIPKNWTDCPTANNDGSVDDGGCGHIFENCTSLLSVTVPEGMTALPAYAFNACNQLKSVSLPTSLNKISYCAFGNCAELFSVQIPEKATVIEKFAFYKCTKLKLVGIHQTIGKIEDYAFSGCAQDLSIAYEGDQIAWASVQIGPNGNEVITVPNASIHFGKTIDMTYGVVRPNVLGNCFYSSPKEVSFSNFYGGYCSSGNEALINVSDAFWGKDAYNVYVSVPKDSYITLYFPHVVYFGDDSYLFLKTTGIVNERADFYAVLEDGSMQFLQTIVEDKEQHEILLQGVSKGVVGIKLVGRDLDGDSPGFDIVDLYLMTHETKLEIGNISKTTVTLNRKGKTYNLFKEEQHFTHGISENCSLLVNPDWNGAEPGYVELSQGLKKKLTNKGGAFVDLMPGIAFSPLESIHVTLYDAAGNIIEARKIKLEIDVAPSSRTNQGLKSTSLTIYENKYDSGKRENKYVLSKGASVMAEGVEYKTNTHGKVCFPSISSGTVTIKKAGFISRTLTLDQLKACKTYYLQPVSKGKPVVSAVWIKNTDVLNQDYSVGLLKKNQTTLTAEVDWGSSSYGGIALMQDSRTAAFTQNTLTTVLSEKFDTSNPIFIVATDAAGHTTKKALKLVSGDEATVIPQALQGAEFSLADSLSFKLPDTIHPSFLAGMEIGADLSSIIPITMTVDQGKVYVAIGIDFVSYSNKDNWVTNSQTGDTMHRLKHETKTFIDKFKETGVLDGSGGASSWKKLKNLKQTYRSFMKYPRGSFGWKADFTVLGFAEGYIDENGKLSILDGGVIVNPSVGYSTSIPFSLGPVPLFFEAGFDADIKAQLNIIFNEAAKKFTPNGQITGAVKVHGGVGVGIKKVASLEGGLEGKAEPDWRIYLHQQDYFKLTASVGAYAKASIAFLEFKKNWDPFYNEVWIEHPKANAASLMEAPNLYDTTEYKVKDLSYLEEGSSFTANKPDSDVSLMAVPINPSALEASVIKTNIYRESTPQLVCFADGTKLAVWLDSTSCDINGVSLYYSFCEGMTWSDPMPVNQDGTMDYAPSLALIGNQAYLVWQNAAKAFTTADTLDSIAPYFDIAVGTFDPKAGFRTTTFASDHLDMLPVVCGQGEQVYVAWVNNAQDLWFGESNGNSIQYAAKTAAGWEPVTTAYSNLNSISSLAADYAESLQLAYCQDADGSLSTAEDTYLWENGVRVTESTQLESEPIYFEHRLYWNGNGVILCREDAEQKSELQISSYQMIRMPDAAAMVYTTGEGLTSRLSVSYYNEEEHRWCEPIFLTDGTTLIPAFSAKAGADGTLQILYNSREVAGTITDPAPYGNSSLVLTTLAPYCDLTMGDLMYSPDQFDAGSTMELSFELMNNGTQPVSSATISVLDENGAELSSILMDDMLVPGQKAVKSTCFDIAAAATRQNIRVRIVPTSLKDMKESDNEQQALLQYEDLAVEETVYGLQDSGALSISANIINYGYTERTQIIAELRGGKPDGALLGTVTIPSVAPLDLAEASFTVEQPQDELYYVVLKNSNDAMTSNDSDFVRFRKDVAPEVIVDRISENELEVYVPSAQKNAAHVIAAIYNHEGRMLTCGMADLPGDGSAVIVSHDSVAASDGDTVRIYLVDSAQQPVAPCMTRKYT